MIHSRIFDSPVFLGRAVASDPLTLTFIESANSPGATDPTVTIPNPVAGDLSVIWNWCGNSGSDVTPTGYTKLLTVDAGGSLSRRYSIFAKVLTGSETTVEGLNGSSFEVWIVASFRPNFAIASFANGMTPNAPNMTDSNPDSQTITASGATSPVALLLGGMACSGTLTGQSTSPAMTAITGTGAFEGYYKVLNQVDSKVNHSFDMGDGGTVNTLVSTYLNVVAA